MDGKIDMVREALDFTLAFLHDQYGYNNGSEVDFYGDSLSPEARETRDKIVSALAALSAIDPDAIRREFWNELHAEAEMQYDRRLELLGPIETLDDAAFRKTLGDGWSAWLLAKRIIENRRSAILSAEPAQGGKDGCARCRNRPLPGASRALCESCKLVIGKNYDPRPVSSEPAQDDGKQKEESLQETLDRLDRYTYPVWYR